MFGFATCRPRDFVGLSSRYRMSRRSAWLADTVEYRSGLLSLRLTWRTSSGHDRAMLSPQRTSVKENKGASQLLLWQVCSRRLPSKPTSSYKCDSGLTATRRFGKDPQRVSGFRPTSLLEFVDPIGHGINHIARRFTSGICLCLNDWARFFALLYYANCFLLRHCYFRVFGGSECIQRNSRHTVPLISMNQNDCCAYACKE